MELNDDAKEVINRLVNDLVEDVMGIVDDGQWKVHVEEDGEQRIYLDLRELVRHSVQFTVLSLIGAKLQAEARDEEE